MVFDYTVGMTGEAGSNGLLGNYDPFTYDGGAVLPGDRYWDYGTMRKINFLIEKLPVLAAKYGEQKLNNWMASAYFCRAYIYFSLARRYGGVPIIDQVQNYPEQSIEELQVSRNKEDAVWECVKEDFDRAISMFPDTPLSPYDALPNKYSAAAMKSRAMLHAASIAKYGTMQLGDLLGVPRNKAAYYFKEAYNAAKILEGKYSLYNKETDKVINFANIFLDKSSPENILVQEFLRPSKIHSWNCHISPKQFGVSYGSVWGPTLNLVGLFGEVPIGTTAAPVRCDSYEQLLTGLEPRLRGSILFPSETFRKQKIKVQTGIFPTFPGTPVTSTDPSVEWEAPGGTKYQICGESGMEGSGTSTGFHIRKYLLADPMPDDLQEWNDQTMWIEMRYAEVLLNRAEAACELYAEGERDADYLQDAFTCMNDVRDRAGAALVADKSTLTDLEIVRLERAKELAFENTTYWDYIRWRAFDMKIDNRMNYRLSPYFVADENKYIFLREQQQFVTGYTFPVRLYYHQIPPGEISKNTNLLPQNPYQD